MTTETTSSGRFTFLVLLLILAGVIALVVIDGNSKRAMAPTLLPQQDTISPFTDDDVLSVDMGEVSIVARVAASDSARVQGLSGTEPLLPHEGLFFVFPRSGMHGIWMKDMNYPIDIMWLDEEFRIVHIASDVAPETYPEVFSPREPARFVLEVSAGIAADAGVRAGDYVAVTENPTTLDLFDAEREGVEREGTDVVEHATSTSEDHE